MNHLLGVDDAAFRFPSLSGVDTLATWVVGRRLALGAGAGRQLGGEGGPVDGQRQRHDVAVFQVAVVQSGQQAYQHAGDEPRQ